MTLSNHSLKRLCYQISRDQGDHDVSSKLLSQVGHQQDRRHLLVPKRSLDLPVLTPERSDNKFSSRNDSTVAQGSFFADVIVRVKSIVDIEMNKADFEAPLTIGLT